MFDFFSSESVGCDYKDFVIVSVDYLPDLETKAVYLRHKTTGLEIYHILSDDRENLFSFAFRTAALNSLGAAHIIEHSVLCGSEKFPLKEPFSTLEAQSVKTFLNAMTYPDRTVYPAASLSKADYFNLMDVYADAVFFPLLTENTFLQEGHRIEMDENGKMSVQGVVYNEMKASYASFSSVAMYELYNTMYDSSFLSFEHGGDPACIPNLDYNQFVAFHKKFYRPDNCLLFLYGNIPTSEQIDFLVEKNYISRLEKKFGRSDFTSKNNSAFPLINEEIKNLQKVVRQKESKTVRKTACDVGASGSMVTLNWYTGASCIEKYFLSEILIGNDSLPVCMKLQESELGEGLASSSGNFSLHPDENLFSLGLTGVKKGNEEKVRSLIWHALQEIYDNGLTKEEIDSVLMGLDFSLRNKNRYGGPFSLNYMRMALSGWVYFKKPSTYLSPIHEFEEFKKRLACDENLIKSMLEKYFFKNPVCIFSIIEPSKKYTESRTLIEKKFISNAQKNLDKKELESQLEKLHANQQRQETAEELSCIPHLKIQDLEIEPDFARYNYFNDDEASVPFLFTPVQTNGIVYMDICFPLDKINPSEYRNLKLFSECFSELGWGGKNWKDCFVHANCIAGDIWAKFFFGSVLDCTEVKESVSGFKNQKIFGRPWISLSSEFLESKSESVFKLLAEIITGMDFNDKKRFMTIFRDFKNSLTQEFVQNSTNYGVIRAEAFSSINTAIAELLNGITQYNYITNLSNDDAYGILNKFSSYYKVIRDSGAFIHITAGKSFLDKARSLLPDLISSAGLKPLSNPCNYPLKEYIAQMYFPENYDDCSCRENLPLSVDSGCGVMSFECSQWLTKKNAAEDVIVNWLNTHALWDKVRLTGAAYGAACSANGRYKIFSMYSWHDPSPARTVSVFLEVLKDLCNHPLSESDIEKSILTCYSDRIVPDGPASKGSLSLQRFLNGTSYECIKKDMELLLSVTPKDVAEAARSLYENALKSRREFIICSDLEQICGNILKVKL